MLFFSFILLYHHFKNIYTNLQGSLDPSGKGEKGLDKHEQKIPRLDAGEK